MEKLNRVKIVAPGMVRTSEGYPGTAYLLVAKSWEREVELFVTLNRRMAEVHRGRLAAETDTYLVITEVVPLMVDSYDALEDVCCELQEELSLDQRIVFSEEHLKALYDNWMRANAPSPDYPETPVPMACGAMNPPVFGGVE